MSAVITQDHRNNSQPSNFNAAAVTCCWSCNDRFTSITRLLLQHHNTSLPDSLRYVSERQVSTDALWLTELQRNVTLDAEEESSCSSIMWSDLMTEQFLLVIITHITQQQTGVHVTANILTAQCCKQLAASPHPKIIHLNIISKIYTISECTVCVCVCVCVILN